MSGSIGMEIGEPAAGSRDKSKYLTLLATNRRLHYCVYPQHPETVSGTKQ